MIVGKHNELLENSEHSPDTVVSYCRFLHVRARRSDVFHPEASSYVCSISSVAALLVTSLHDLVRAPDLQLDWVVTPVGPHGEVTWAHATELIDPSTYLRGGELVCTVGTNMADRAACGRFVESVARAHASGICFGLGDVHTSIPQGLVEACSSLDVALLAAPFGAPFLLINEFLAQERLAQESALLRRDGELLTDVLARVRQHASPQQLIDYIATSIDGRWELHVGDAIDVVGGDMPSQSQLSTSVESRHDDLALVWTGYQPPPSSLLMATLAQVLDVVRRERDVEQDLDRERIGHLLALVRDRVANPMALESFIEAAGLGRSELIFSVWPAGAARVLVAAAETPQILLGETPEVSIAVTPDAASVLKMADRLGVVCGYSSVVSLDESVRGLGEARAAFELARPESRSIGPSGLTTLEGLLRQQPSQRLEPFVDQLISPLIEIDHRRNTDLVHTLSTYLDNDGSLVRTARAEFLHVNTVRHRLERIAEITGRDPQVFSDRVALAIALWAYRN